MFGNTVREQGISLAAARIVDVGSGTGLYIREWLALVGPLFVTLGAPIATPSRYPARLWNAIMKRAAARGLGNVPGASLYPVEKLLRRLVASGPITKLVICRRSAAAVESKPA